MREEIDFEKIRKQKNKSYENNEPEFEIDIESDENEKMIEENFCMKIENCDCPPHFVKLTCGCVWCYTCVLLSKKRNENQNDLFVHCEHHWINVEPVINQNDDDEDYIGDNTEGNDDEENIEDDVDNFDDLNESEKFEKEKEESKEKSKSEEEKELENMF